MVGRASSRAELALLGREQGLLRQSSWFWVLSRAGGSGRIQPLHRTVTSTASRLHNPKGFPILPDKHGAGGGSKKSEFSFRISL